MRKDPDEFITDLELLVDKMNQVTVPGMRDKNDTDMFVNIFGNMREEYDEMISHLQRAHSDNSPNFNMYIVRSALGFFWNQL